MVYPPQRNEASFFESRPESKQGWNKAGKTDRVQGGYHHLEPEPRTDANYYWWIGKGNALAYKSEMMGP